MLDNLTMQTGVINSDSPTGSNLATEISSVYAFQVGSLELLVGIITVLGILLAFNTSIVREYEKIISHWYSQSTKLKKSISIKEKNSLEIGELNRLAVILARMYSAENAMKEYKEYHSWLTISGIIVSIVSGILILNGTLPAGMATIALVILASIVPSLGHMSLHKIKIRRRMPLYENHGYGQGWLFDANA